MRVIGIDLGTTNSVVAFVDEAGQAHAIADKDGSRILPSAVWFPSDESGRVEVGAVAKRRRTINPSDVATLFKRGMGRETFRADGTKFTAHGREWRPEHLSSIIIKKLVEVAEMHLGETITDVVVTVPAYFGEAERAATRLAGEIAGMTVHLLPAEPMAAAVAHGLQENSASGRMLVFDLGGGTFDVTILDKGPSGELEAVAHNGDRQLGGADFDKLIVDRMAQHAARELNADLFADPEDLANAWDDAERLKIDLSTRDQADATLIVGGGRMHFSLSRAEFEEMLADSVETTELAVESALDIADLTADKIDVVLMVGGSSRIPAFKEMLKEYFQKEPIFSKNLDEDVARGAALMGVLALGTAPEGSALARLPAPKDRASHPIGVSALDDAGVLKNYVVLPSNSPKPTPIPAEQVFSTVQNGQDRIELTINEGDEEDLRLVAELGRAEGYLGGPKPVGYPIKVRMSFDKDAILTATAHDGHTDELIAKVVVHHTDGMSAEQAQEAQQTVSDIVVI